MWTLLSINVHLGEEIERRYEADKAKASVDLKTKYCSSFKLFRLKTYQRYFVDLFSIDLFHSAVVDAIDSEVHEEDCQKVVGGSRGPTVTKIQDSDVFTSKIIRNWAWGHSTLYWRFKLIAICQMMKCQPNAEEETHGNIYKANHKKTYKSRSCLKVISIIWTCLLSRFFPFLSFDLTWCDLVLSSQSCLKQTLCTSTARILKMAYLKFFEIKLFQVPAIKLTERKMTQLRLSPFCVCTYFATTQRIFQSYLTAPML